MDEPTRCADLADTLAEVATGSASGPDRARVLAHLGTCESCRRELDELTQVADEVLLIAPEREPPAGFESAVLDRIAAASGAAEPGTTEVGGPSPATPLDAARSRRRVLRPALAAAAAAVVLAGASAAAVWQTTEADRELAASYRDTLDVADGQYFTATDLTEPDGDSAGTVFFYEGEPSWLVVIVRSTPQLGTYDVVVETAGSEATVGACTVAEATCSVGTAIDTHVYDIDRIRLDGPDGFSLTTVARR